MVNALHDRNQQDELPIRSVVLDLRWSDDECKVVDVTPRNEQRFRIQKNRAIDILRQAKNAEDFSQQLNLLLTVLAEWLGPRREKLSGAYLTLQDSAFSFVVITKAVEYDPDLEDELSALDVSIANDRQLDRIHLNVTCMPPASSEALASFLDDEFCLTYNGFSDGPSEAGE